MSPTGQELAFFTKLPFVDIGVESKVVAIAEQVGNLANREAQSQQLLDAFTVDIKLAFLNDAFRFPQFHSLPLFSC